MTNTFLLKLRHYQIVDPLTRRLRAHPPPMGEGYNGQLAKANSMTDTPAPKPIPSAPIEVPADAYWGAQTQRSLENFPFATRERMPIGLVHAQAIVKQAAARVNRKHGLDGETADAVEAAAKTITSGKHDDQFPAHHLADRFGNADQYERERSNRWARQ